MTTRTCELYNEDNDRKAVVFVDKSLGEDIWCVDCYEGAHFVRLIECKDHNEQYVASSPFPSRRRAATTHPAPEPKCFDVLANSECQHTACP